MWRTLKFIKNYLIGILLGMLFGVLTYIVQPVRWEAHALLKLAHYSTLTSPSPSSFILESAPIVIERLKTPSFLVAATERAKSNHVKISQDYDKCKCVQARLIGYKDDLSVLMITVDSNDPASSLGAVDSVVKQLQFKHQELLDQFKAESNSWAVLFQRNIDSTNNKILQNVIADYNITNTRLIEPVYVEEHRLFSSLLKALLFGSVLGIFLSVVWMRFK